MIDLSQDLLVALLVRSLLCGAGLGVFYDLMRTVKMFFGVCYGVETAPLRLAKRAVIFTVTFITDMVFWLSAGLLSIALLYGIGGGIFRGMTYLCLAIGFAVYYFTVGRLSLKLERATVSFVKMILKKTALLLLRPIKMALRGLIFLYHLTIGRIIGKIKERCRLSRIKKQKDKLEMPDNLGGNTEEKEDLVYVDGRTGYRKSGRVSFGGKANE